MKKSFRISVLALASAFTLYSCGGKTEETTESTETAPTEEMHSEHEIVAEPASNDLHIESNDQMQYTTNELKAPAGTIKLTLHHVGKMEKTVMGHNLVILKQGTDPADFAQKAADAKDTDYIPASEKANVIAHTKIIGGGESDTIEFTIEEKGTYDFICSFPGHVAIMKGKLIVE